MKFLELASLVSLPVLHVQYDLRIGYLYAEGILPELRRWQANFIR